MHEGEGARDEVVEVGAAQPRDGPHLRCGLRQRDLGGPYPGRAEHDELDVRRQPPHRLRPRPQGHRGALARVARRVEQDMALRRPRPCASLRCAVRDDADRLRAHPETTGVVRPRGTDRHDDRCGRRRPRDGAAQVRATEPLAQRRAARLEEDRVVHGQHVRDGARSRRADVPGEVHDVDAEARDRPYAERRVQ